MKKSAFALCTLLTIPTFAEDFSNLSTPTKNLYPSDIIQKSASDIKFDEFMHSVPSPKGTTNLSFDTLVTKYKVNGLGIVIIEDGKITQEHYYGHETKDKITPISSATRFQAASMSKFIAGLSAAVAADKGYVELGKKVSVMANENPTSLLDEWRDKKFKNNEISYPENISLKRLLNHSAGLDTWGIGTTSQNVNLTMEKILIGDGFFLTADGVRPQNQPGVESYYSGGGFVVAELMLEIATGQSYADFATEHVLEKAKMGKSTMDEIDEFTPDMAWGCSYDCDWTPEKTLVKSAGGLITTPKNYAKLLFPLMNMGIGESGERVFNEAVIKDVLTPGFHKDSSKNACTKGSDCPKTRSFTVGNFTHEIPADESCFQNQCQQILRPVGFGNIHYGLGVFIDGELLEDGYHRYVSHGGAHTGFRTQFRVDRKTKNGVVFMINGTDEVEIDGVLYGATALKAAIENAYIEKYE
jgi:CubicO group peptidase (beta-lactamase class C family)